MVSDSFRVPFQTFGQVVSLMEGRHTDSGKPEVILTFMDALLFCILGLQLHHQHNYRNSATFLAHNPVLICSI